MPLSTCPACDRLLSPQALGAGRCPGCGKALPMADGSQAAGQGSWFTLIALVLVGLAGGLLFGMARFGHLTGPWVIVPVLILVGLVVGRVFELRRNRRSRNAPDREGEP